VRIEDYRDGIPRTYRTFGSCAENQPVGRANWIILVMGLATCVAMSWAMQQLVTVQEQEARPQVVREVDDLWARRLVGPTGLELRQVGEHSLAELTVLCLPEFADRRFADEIGEFAWGFMKAEEGLDALLVRFLSVDEPPLTFQVHPAFVRRAPRTVASDADIVWRSKGAERSGQGRVRQDALPPRQAPPGTAEPDATSPTPTVPVVAPTPPASELPASPPPGVRGREE
jgi:hypothetical protein